MDRRTDILQQHSPCYG